MDYAAFALQIVHTPAGGTAPGSTMNSLRSAWSGTSGWCQEPYIRAKPECEDARLNYRQKLPVDFTPGLREIDGLV